MFVSQGDSCVTEREDISYTPWCTVTLSPLVKAALLAEIEKALPGLLRKALASTKKAKPPMTAPKVRTRMRAGRPKELIMKAIRTSPEEGVSREQIRKMAPLLSRGQTLNENTLKRWLFVLKRDGAIENVNGRWFEDAAAAAYRTRPRDNARPEDDYQEKDTP